MKVWMFYFLFLSKPSSNGKHSKGWKVFSTGLNTVLSGRRTITALPCASLSLHFQCKVEFPPVFLSVCLCMSASFILPCETVGYFPNLVPSVMMEVLKNWCLWTVMLEKTLESPLDCKEIQPVNPKGNQSWIFIGRTDAEAEAPILWPPDAKSQLIGKDLDAGIDWRQEEKGMTEDEMVGWHHRLNGHELQQTPGDSEGRGSLACCSPCGCKELDTT